MENSKRSSHRILVRLYRWGKTLPGHCNGGSITGPIGINGTLIGPARALDTMRMNGANATYISGSIVELAPGQTPKGSVSSSTTH